MRSIVIVAGWLRWMVGWLRLAPTLRSLADGARSQQGNIELACQGGREGRELLTIGGIKSISG